MTTMIRETAGDMHLHGHLNGHVRYVMAAFSEAMRTAAFDVLVIAAGDNRLAFQDDQAYPYRANPWFRWPAPVPAAPGSILLIGTKELPELILVMPKDFWHAPPEAPEGAWTALFHITCLESPQQALEHVAPIRGRVAWIGESRPPEPDWTANPPELLAQLEQHRCRKTAYELQCMRGASLSGARGHLAAEKTFRQGLPELDIHLAFLGASRQNEAELPYGSIVALNEHAATLHYQMRDKTAPRHIHSLLIDAGATESGYASDITRTWAAGTGLFADLLQGMEILQQQLCAQARADADWRDLHLQAQLKISELLRTAGILDMDAEEAVQQGVSAHFLPHGLGHLLGLQVHDVGGFRPAAGAAEIPRPEGHPYLRLTRRLEPGMVVTVEPGLYFIDSLLHTLQAGPHGRRVDWALVDHLRPCGGIRIEDNVAITVDGNENLTRDAFAAIARG